MNNSKEPLDVAKAPTNMTPAQVLESWQWHKDRNIPFVVWRAAHGAENWEECAGEVWNFNAYVYKIERQDTKPCEIYPGDTLTTLSNFKEGTTQYAVLVTAVTPLGVVVGGNPPRDYTWKELREHFMVKDGETWVNL